MAIPYVYIPHGHGGIYTLRIDASLSQPLQECIGSHGCRINCVFVYVKLDDTNCFAAHIDAGENPNKPTILTTGEGFELQRALRQALNNIRLDFPSNERPVIVCPRHNVWHEGESYRTVGSYIVNELYRFFLPPGVPPRPVQVAHGVAVDHHRNSMTFMPYRSNDPTAVMQHILLLLDDKKGAGLSQGEQDFLEKLCKDHIEERTPQEMGLEQLNVDDGEENGSWRFLLIDGKWKRGNQQRAADLPVRQ